MRRLLFAAMAAVLACAAAGCSTAKDASTAVGAPGAAVAPEVAKAGDDALANDTNAICGQASKTTGQFASMWATDHQLLADAAKSKDAALTARAQQKSKQDVQNYAYAMDDLSKLAGDASLKQALGSMSKQVAALKGDVKKADDKLVAALQATLDKACHR